MRRQKADRGAIDTLKNHFLGKLIPGVGTWGELDVLRGWRDDFLGRVIADQYTPVTNGAGSGGTLAYATHGLPNGVYRLTAGAVIGAYQVLALGDNAATYPSLDADQGWVMISRRQLSHTISIAAEMGAWSTTAVADLIESGANTVLSNNWIVFSRTGGGAVLVTDSGIAIDTLMHWHRMEVYPLGGGNYECDYYLDGSLIVQHTQQMPAIALTPLVWVYAAAAASRYVNLDFWAVTPRNLA